MTAYEELGVMPEIGKAVDEMGWMLPTDIQVCIEYRPTVQRRRVTV